MTQRQIKVSWGPGMGQVGGPAPSTYGRAPIPFLLLAAPPTASPLLPAGPSPFCSFHLRPHPWPHPILPLPPSTRSFLPPHCSFHTGEALCPRHGLGAAVGSESSFGHGATAGGGERFFPRPQIGWGLAQVSMCL
ncbi:hypothetical protein KIL84_004636 [Mauremys mutica]|uniref:Uncharacterized protein n=1 Tax=Mauremys mutica TaxID=74926 RepID=A0A9D3XKH5_9SAUR|nr:hypothetical protein KIL84_004636 [Mauremys mutica]